MQQGAFQVLPFRMGQIHRVIRTGTQLPEELGSHPRLGRSGEEYLTKELPIDGAATTEREQVTARLDSPEGQSEDVLVRARGPRQVRLPASKRRRIAHDDVVPLAPLAQVLEDVALDGLESSRLQTVAPAESLGNSKQPPGGFDERHALRPVAQGSEAEASGVSEKIEHLASSGKSRRELSVLSLVAVPARFLTLEGICLTDQAMLPKLDGPFDDSPGDFGARRKTLWIAKAAARPHHQRELGKEVCEGPVQLPAKSLRASRGDLGDENPSEPIDGPPRDTIAFRVDKPVAVGIGSDEIRPQLERTPEPLPEKLRPDRGSTPREEPHTDVGAGAVETHSQALPAQGVNLGKCRVARPVGPEDGSRIEPRMSVPNRPLALGPHRDPDWTIAGEFPAIGDSSASPGPLPHPDPAAPA